MTSINTNAAAMAAVRSLASISGDLGKTQARVESGLRISRANDDPAVFAIAQNMRADLNTFSAVKDSLAFGGAALTVARDAMTKISNELGTLKATITQGQQQGLDATQINNQIRNALDNIDAYAKSATFNGVNLLTADVTGVAGVNYNNLDVVHDIQGSLTSVTGTNSTAAGLGLRGSGGSGPPVSGTRLTFDVSSAFPDHVGAIVIDMGVDPTKPSEGDQIYYYTFVAPGSGSPPYSHASIDSIFNNPQAPAMLHDNTVDYFPRPVPGTGLVPESLDNLAFVMQSQGINAIHNSGSGAIDIIGTVKGTQFINLPVAATAAPIPASGAGSGTDLTIATGGWQASFTSSLAPKKGETVDITIGGEHHIFEFSDGSQALTTEPDATHHVYDVQFAATDSPLEMIGNLITRMQGAGISAGLTNDGRLQVRGAVTAMTSDITGTDTVEQIGGAEGAIAAVEGAIDLVGTRLGDIGAALRQMQGLQDFTSSLTDSVKEGLGALVDADLAEESARLTSLQTKQQLATQSLSIANQQSQSLLSLFR